VIPRPLQLLAGHNVATRTCAATRLADPPTLAKITEGHPMRIRQNVLGLLATLVLSFLGTSIANAQGVHMHAVLVGGNEIPNPGHPTGFGTAAITFRAQLTQICVVIVVNGLSGTPTGAHIHSGFGPQAPAGNIVVPLNTTTGVNPGFSTGCYSITAQQSAALRGNPSRFYINVHTSTFPSGAVRGQLFQ
jgi:hypothetical protein